MGRGGRPVEKVTSRSVFVLSKEVRTASLRSAKVEVEGTEMTVEVEGGGLNFARELPVIRARRSLIMGCAGGDEWARSVARSGGDFNFSFPGGRGN